MFKKIFNRIKKDFLPEKEYYIFLSIVIFIISLLIGIFTYGAKLAFIVALIHSIYFLVVNYIVTWLLLLLMSLILYIQIKINEGTNRRNS
jgi:heme A synthase